MDGAIGKDTAASGTGDARCGQDPLFEDTLFRQKRKKGEWRIVNAPKLQTSCADTHAHLQLLRDPVLTLARASAHDVHFICDIIDIYEDDAAVFDSLETWNRQAAIAVRKLVGHPC